MLPVKVKANIDRFSGFADVYSCNRPVVPKIAIEIITKYLGRKPRLIVDIGCGPGISSFPWSKYTEQVIGIEPNQDMLNQAIINLQHKKGIKNVSFQFGYSNKTGLKSNIADVVTCSQSFHWMEPKSSLKEISRILVKGGIFATIDYDWPPSIDWIVEQEFRRFSNRVNEIFLKHVGETRDYSRWSKDQHLTNIRNSKRFRFGKEVLFHHQTTMNAEQFIGLVISLGSVNRFLKEYPNEISADFQRFKNIVNKRINEKYVALLSYRMRIGIK
jgi:ubiquinone/menaquinone biosynthesis C-methylase UbiE